MAKDPGRARGSRPSCWVSAMIAKVRRRRYPPGSALPSVDGKSTPHCGGRRVPTYLRGSSRFFTGRLDESERVLERKAANPKLRMAGSGALPPEAPDPAPNRYTGGASRKAEGDRHGPLSGPRRTRQFEDQGRLRPLVYPKAKPGQWSSGRGPLQPREIAAATKNPAQIPLLNRCDKRFHVRWAALGFPLSAPLWEHAFCAFPLRH